MATTFAALRRIVRTRLNETLALTTPGSPIVSPQGTPATEAVGYAIVATNAVGHSDASQTTTTTLSADTLSATDFNRLTWQAVPGATGYDVYRTTTTGASPPTTGKIGSATATTFDDTGLAGDSTTAPTTNTSGIANPYWTDPELFDLLMLGAKDLWRSIVDLHQGHFTTINEEDVSLEANDDALTGVPDDTHKVLMIEPRSLASTETTSNVYFKPKQYHSQVFQSARAQVGLNPAMAATIYYDLLNAGSPVDTISVVVAPRISGPLDLRFVYVHTLPVLIETDNNPIPGESDNALISWTVAWARAKVRDDGSPDPAWIATYSTDKQSLLTALTPRQEQEEEVVEGMFEGLMEGW